VLPAGVPEFWVTHTLAALFCRIWSGLINGISLTCSALIDEIAPVSSRLVWVPYLMITTSFKYGVLSASQMEMT
jgi:hypothetical protein